MFGSVLRKSLVFLLALALVAALWWGHSTGAPPPVEAADPGQVGDSPSENVQASTDPVREESSVDALIVRVNTAYGHPDHGAPVGLLGGTGLERRKFWVGRTGAHGAAAVPMDAITEARALGTVIVAVLRPMPKPVTAVVPPELPPFLELTQVNVGAVVVFLRPRTRRFDGARRVCVRALEPGERMGQHPPLAATWHLVGESEDGKFWFDNVGYESRLMIWVEEVHQDPGVPSLQDVVYTVGPTRRTRTRDLEISVDQYGRVQATHIAGRVFTAQGATWADALVEASLRGARTGKSQSAPLFTDGAGCFRLARRRDELPKGASLKLSAEPGVSVRALRSKGTDRVTQLGSFVLGEDVALVRGRIQDGSGRGVHRTRIQVEQVFGAGAEDTHWVSADLSTRSDPDGKFVIHGILPGDLRLIVSDPLYARSAPVPFRAGDREVEITLRPGGSLTGSVARADADLLEVGMSLRGPLAEADPQSFRGKWGQDGEFSWTRLPPGLYELRVESLGQVLRTIPGVRVVGGRDNRPAQIQDVAVRGHGTR